VIFETELKKNNSPRTVIVSVSAKLFSGIGNISTVEGNATHTQNWAL
jgi:hypothetical protein